MKLIKKGKKEKGENKFRGTCRACFAEFEADRSELHVEHGDQRDLGDFAHKTCPECQRGDILFYPKS